MECENRAGKAKHELHKTPLTDADEKLPKKQQPEDRPDARISRPLE
jgi:hypothetical protein